MRKILVGFLGVACLLPTAALADRSGPYISGHFGLSMPEKTTSEFNSPGLPGGVGFINSDADVGHRFGGALGWTFNRYLSAEVELSYAKHDIDTLNAFVFPGVWTGPLAARGDATSLSGMVNGYLSYPMQGFRPYVGAGIGMTRVDSNHVGIIGVANETNDHDSAFSWQLMAGAGFKLSPDLELGARYRFLHVNDMVMYATNGDQQRIHDSQAHSVELVLTWSLHRDPPRTMK